MKLILATAAALVLAAWGPASVRAQAAARHGAPARSPASSGTTGTRIVLLGTAGGPRVRKSRSEPASLLVVGGRPYLIDAGEGVVRQLVWAGFHPAQVDTIFLTHLHFDHTEGLVSFLAFDWTDRRTKPVGIYGPPGTALLVKRGLDYDSIAEAIFKPELPTLPPMATLFQAHDLDVSSKPTVVFQDDRVRVLAVENSHYATMHLPERSYGKDKSYSYRFETPGRTVVFTGDTGPSQALVNLAKGADVLVSEVIDLQPILRAIDQGYRSSGSATPSPLVRHMTQEHLTPEEVGKIASAAGVKSVVLTHLVPGPRGQVDAMRYIAGVKRYFSGPVSVGYDLARF